MTSDSLLCQLFILLLGYVVLASSASPDQGKTMDSSDTQTAGCNGLSCETTDNVEVPSESNFLDGGSTGLKLGEEKLPLKIEENALPAKKLDNIENSQSDLLSDENSIQTEPGTPHSDSKTSVELESPKTTETVEHETSNLQSSSDSDSQEESESPSLLVFGMKKKTTVKQGSEEGPVKHKLFPFLYTSLFSTFKSLLRSLLSEFVEDGAHQDGAANTSEWTNQSSPMAEEEATSDLNATSNGTETVKKTRFQCSIKNITADSIGKVKVVNSTELLDILSLSKSQKSSACVLVMFYAPWCHFCAQTAPHYNALARAFPQLDILAVDTSHFSYLNARFGTVAVPNIMLFHSRSAVRFNHTQRVLEKFTQFVTNNTGLEPRRFVLLEPLDFVGPLPCLVKRNRDWLLWLAWVFVATCSAYGFVQSQYGQGFIAKLKVLWQEHQHID